MAGDIGQAHDKFYKALMEQPGVAAALLAEHLPAEVAALLTKEPPELMEGSFVDEHLRGSQLDRLYRVKTQTGAPAFVYCLVEHKSEPDPRIGLQLLRYLTRVWDHLDGVAGSKGLLPPVFPLVVYHGAPDWKHERRFSALIEASEEVKRHLLDFPWSLLDVGHVVDDPLSRDEVLRAGLLVMKYARRELGGGQLEVLELLLRALAVTPERFFQLSVRYITWVYRNLDQELLREAIHRTKPEQEEQIMSTLAEQWMAEGEARGEAKSLFKVIELRFGSVPEARRQQIFRSTDSEQLTQWLTRAVVAKDLDAVFAPEDAARH